MRRIAIIAAFVINILTATAWAGTEPNVRILIDRGEILDEIGATRGNLTIIHDDKMTQLQKAAISLKNDSIVLNGAPISSESVEIRAEQGMLEYNKKLYYPRMTVSKKKHLLLLINLINLENYLIGIIGSEVGPNWPIEAAKAQAVASRTYALRQKISKRDSASYDLETDVNDQVYLGAQKENAVAKNAVASTRGEVLLKNGKIFHSYFHSCCGGETEIASHVWKGTSGTAAIKDPYCQGYPNIAWTYIIPKAKCSQLLDKFKHGISPDFEISTTNFPDSPRVENIIFTDDEGMQMVHSNELRKILGYNNVKSTWFTANEDNGNIIFRGKGAGHGVGMCQWGSRGMANKGKRYKEILGFYYNDAKVVKIY